MSVDRATVYDPEQGLSLCKETIFELETRKASSSWSNADSSWTDEVGSLLAGDLPFYFFPPGWAFVLVPAEEPLEQ